MITKPKETRRSKIALAYWMKKGWLQYVSIKKGSYTHIKSYTIELYREREHLMDLIIDMELKIEDGEIIQDALIEEQMNIWQEVYQTIDLELHGIHERYSFNELFSKNQRYRGIETFLYEDEEASTGFYCKVEQLDFDYKDGGDYAIYLYIDTPITIVRLLELSDNILDFQTELDDPGIEITLLSMEDVYEIKNALCENKSFFFQPVSSL